MISSYCRLLLSLVDLGCFGVNYRQNAAAGAGLGTAARGTDLEDCGEEMTNS
jgi:hypothetical protein